MLNQLTFKTRTLLRKSFLFNSLRSFWKQEQYCIHKAYRHRIHNVHFNDIENTDEWQKEVYQYAKNLAKENSYNSIIDIGCGSGYKLLRHFGEYPTTIGIDVGNTYEFLKKKYPHKIWLDANELDYSQLEADLVISSDVIEHLLDPVSHLSNIKKIKGVKSIIISTPDRLLLDNKYGPPRNETHIREWTGTEFRRFIESQNFKIISHQITNYEQATQMVACKKN